MTDPETKPKTLMEISSFKTAVGAARPVMTIKPDGSIVYGEPMTQAEVKAALSEVIENRMHDHLVGQALSAMIFASELSRLSRENEELKRRLAKRSWKIDGMDP